MTKTFQILSRNDAAIILQLLSEHIGINEYYHTKNYSYKSVLREIETKNHYNALLQENEYFELYLQSMDDEITNMKNEISLHDTYNRNNIPQLIPINVQNYNVNENEFKSLYDDNDYSIPLDQQYYNIPQNILDERQSPILDERQSLMT